MLSNTRLTDIANWTSASVTGKLSDALVTDISSDSREIKKGSLFVAIKGETFDGHDYLAEIATKGAIAALVDKIPANAPKNLPLIQVKETVHGMADIGRNLRKKFRGPVFAITGSAGKSSTKHMLGSLLGIGAMVSPKSYNNLLGVSKTLFLVDDGIQKLVLEMGMNALGELKEICEYFEPDQALITNIGTAHIGRLGGQENIYKAKKEVFDWIGKSSSLKKAVAVNLDDKLIVRAADEALPKTVRRITYSAQSGSAGGKAEVQILSKSLHPQTGALRVQMRFGGAKGEYEVPVFGLHQAENLAAAVAGALLMGESTTSIEGRLSSIRSAEHRGEMFKTKSGVSVLDESYNSNPSALVASMRSTFELDSSQRRVLVLGEMRELDAFSEKLHTEAADALVQIHNEKGIPFVLIGVGTGFRPFLDKVKKMLPGVESHFAQNAAEATTLLESRLKAGDIVLVKGSRGIALDLVVKKLQEQAS